jgi:hypothetical protein
MNNLILRSGLPDACNKVSLITVPPDRVLSKTIKKKND